MLLNWGTALHFVPTLGREAGEARADVAWVRTAAAALPPDALVISANTGLWCLLETNTVQPETAAHLLDADPAVFAREHSGGIYLHWDYWANVEPQGSAPIAGPRAKPSPPSSPPRCVRA